MLNTTIYKTTLLFLVLTELLSVFAWKLPVFGNLYFYVLVLLCFLCAIKKLEYGLYILFAELFVGSQGYLFSLNLGAGETLISIRIGLFIAIMLAWVFHLFKSVIPSEARACESEVEGPHAKSLPTFNRIYLVLKSYYTQFPLSKYYLALAVVIFWGLILGVFKNNFGFVFLDFNNWLYFLILLPVLHVTTQNNSSIKTSHNHPSFLSGIFSVLTASTVWIFIKTAIVLYFFSHGFDFYLPEMYKWIRDTRVGEITRMSNNFYRIFFQSHIYSLLFFFIVLIFNFQFSISKKNSNFKSQILNLLLITIALTTTIISFSRSFWAGLIGGFIILLFYYFIILKDWQKGLKIICYTAISGLLSAGMILLIINLPPKISGESLANLFGQRTTQIEAAGSSRINMLKPLFNQITKNPIFGSGFGTTVTYKSVDPRILSTTAGASGEYTTYAFEWAYLDLILKFGLIGLLVYLGLILKIAWGLYKKIKQTDNTKLYTGALIALISLLVVNIFTPYLNHPLGIGFLIISSIIVLNTKTIQSQL